MLESQDLHAYYGKSHILHGVDMHVGEGEIVSLLGRNGSGRSTTVKAIMGLVDGDGSVRCDGPGNRWASKRLRDRAPRHRLRAREPRHLPQAHGAPEPAARRRSAAQTKPRWTFDDMYKHVPAPEGAPSTPRPACCRAASSRC